MSGTAKVGRLRQPFAGGFFPRHAMVQVCGNERHLLAQLLGGQQLIAGDDDSLRSTSFVPYLLDFDVLDEVGDERLHAACDDVLVCIEPLRRGGQHRCALAQLRLLR